MPKVSKMVIDKDEIVDNPSYEDIVEACNNEDELIKDIETLDQCFVAEPEIDKSVVDDSLIDVKKKKPRQAAVRKSKSVKVDEVVPVNDVIPGDDVIPVVDVIPDEEVPIIVDEKPVEDKSKSVKVVELSQCDKCGKKKDC